MSSRLRLLYYLIMKYNIFINQKALSETKLDIKDAAILDYLMAFCGIDNKNIKQMNFEEKGKTYRYTWINFRHLIKEMPLLRIKSKGAITKRVENIKNAGFIKTFLAPEGSLYIRITEKAKEVLFESPVHENEQPRSQKRTAPFTDVNSTNIVSYNNNISNNTLETISISDFNSFIKMFETVNPSYKQLYANKTQRSALERLIRDHGENKIRELLRILPQVNDSKYCPEIFTPLQLESKLAQLLIFLKKRSKPAIAEIS